MVELSERLRALRVLDYQSEYEDQYRYESAHRDIAYNEILDPEQEPEDKYLQQLEPIIPIISDLNTEEKVQSIEYGGHSWEKTISFELEELFVKVASKYKYVFVNALAGGANLAVQIAYKNPQTMVELLVPNEPSQRLYEFVFDYLDFPNVRQSVVKMEGKGDVHDSLVISLGPFGLDKDTGITKDLVTASELTTLYSSQALMVVSDSALFKGGETANMRGMLIELDKISGVISLDFTQSLKELNKNIRINLLILGEEAENIGNIYLASNRIKTKRPEDEQFHMIMKLLKKDLKDVSTKSMETLVSKLDLAENNFILNPERYLSTETSKNLDLLIGRYDSDYLGNLFDIIRPVPLKNDPNGEFLIKEVMIGDLTDKEVIDFKGIQGKELSLSLSGYIKIKDQLIKENDILFSVKATIGKCSLFVFSRLAFSWPKSVKQKPVIETPAYDDPQLSANQGLFIFRKKKVCPISAETLFSYISSNYVVETLAGKATGSTLKHLPIKILKELEVPLPDTTIQESLLENLRERTSLRRSIERDLAAIDENIAETWPNLEVKSMEAGD